MFDRDRVVGAASPQPASVPPLPASQSWTCLLCYNSMATTLQGQATLESSNGRHRPKHYGQSLDICIRSALDVDVEATAATLVITSRPAMPGCVGDRLVINRDGSGGHREFRGATGWMRDPNPRLLTAKT